MQTSQLMEFRPFPLAEYDRQVNKLSKMRKHLKSKALVFLSGNPHVKPEPRNCFKCGLLGHLMRDCKRYIPNFSCRGSHKKVNQKQRPSSQIEERGAHFVAALVTEDACTEFLLDSVATDCFCNDKILFSNF